MSVIRLERCSTPDYLSESSEPSEAISDIEPVELIAENTYYDPIYDYYDSWLEGLEQGVPYYVDETDPEEFVPTFGIHLSVASSPSSTLSSFSSEESEESSLDITSHPPYEDESFADDEADSESITDTDIEDTSYSYEWGVTISASE